MRRLEQLEDKAKLLKMLKLDKRRILKTLCEEGALKKTFLKLGKREIRSQGFRVNIAGSQTGLPTHVSHQMYP